MNLNKFSMLTQENVPIKQGNDYVYYQDRKFEWKFYTKEKGYNLLMELLKKQEKILAHCVECLKDKFGEEDAHRLMEKGAEIYDQKPSKGKGTWSQEEYDNMGFVYSYLKFKCFQRFTETYTLLERCKRCGYFDQQGMQTKKKIVVASIGGGPGYELYAWKVFFAEYFPEVKLRLISLDLSESWKDYANILDCEFIKWNINDDGLVELCGGQIDYGIISYVLFQYMNNDTCSDMMARWLMKENISSLFINERKEFSDNVEKMINRGIGVFRLMDNSRMRDDRQLIYLPDKGHLNQLVPLKMTLDFTFPNVPYEDRKRSTRKRRRFDHDIRVRHQRPRRQYCGFHR